MGAFGSQSRKQLTNRDMHVALTEMFLWISHHKSFAMMLVASIVGCFVWWLLRLIIDLIDFVRRPLFDFGAISGGLDPGSWDFGPPLATSFRQTGRLPRASKIEGTFFRYQSRR